jgi:uncharacterized membrane protein YfcA
MLIVLFGVVTGLALGLTGGGGSIFAMPLLLHGAGSSVAQAVAVSSLAVASASLVGAIRGLRTGLVDVRSGAMFAITGVVAAPFGVHIGQWLSDSTRLVGFGALLLIIGPYMWRKARAPESRTVRAQILRGSPEEAGPACRYSPEGRLHITTPCAMALLASGLLTGVLSGVFGVGGGFLIVPVLRATTGLSMHRALATSLLVIVLISGSTAVASWIGIPIDTRLTIEFVAGSIAGLIAGTFVVKRLAGPTLQRTFAVLVVAMGLALLSQSLLRA